MDVMQAIKERRAIRKYRPDPVSDEALRTVLEAARWAPSWGNSQCLKLIVVRDPSIKSQLADTLRSKTPGGKNSATDGFRTAGVALVACAADGLSGCYKGEQGETILATDKGKWWLMFDVGLAMQNLTLAAHALGLGTVHIGMFDAEKVRQILGIPENLTIVEMLVLGWPDEKPAPRPRKEISEFVTYDKYSR
ncbi:MAG: nitroreductase family protein [Chloroflexota bacterium]|nr:nitroreductase family protein [Chloroflexota bacterium]